MSIVWGDSIPVKGVRPAWLRDESIQWAVRTSPGYFTETTAASVRTFDREDWAAIVSIRLPADHPYYKATAEGFTYWPGGSEAPADWDGGEVLVKDTHVRVIQNPEPHNWSGTKWRAKIIGYRQRVADTWQPDERAVDAVVAWLDAHDYMIVAERIIEHFYPTPVDPDLIEARRIAADLSKFALFGERAVDGQHDDSDSVRLALAAIKRGRQLGAQS